MSKRIIKLLLPIFVLGLFIPAQNFVIGQSAEYDSINEEIKMINDEIQNNQKRIKDIQEKQSSYSTAIQKAQKEKASLNNQLAILDNRVAKAELDIETVKTDINRTNLEIKKTNLEMDQLNAEIDVEKEHVSNILKLLNQQDRVSSLEILLLNNSLAEFLGQVKYLENLNDEINNSLDNLKKGQRDIEKEQLRLKQKNIELAEYQKEMEEKKANLESEKETKVTVLGQVNMSERQYQNLLAQAKAEQEEASADIASLERLVRAKVAEMEGEKLEFNDNGLIWPVKKNVITTYFHDPDYPFRYIFEHPAIDIRAEQGSTIKAAASGYVARAKDGGLGYSYIMIVHGDGLSTVYGHVSKIEVDEDEYVVQGQTIGKSGGTPGTPGAGTLTTGPHLHFEVRLNGIPVDPLAYLP